MKHLLIMTFDIIRSGEPHVPLSSGYLLSYLRSDSRFEDEFIVDYLSFNLNEEPNIGVDFILNIVTKKCRLRDLDIIAIGSYIWSDRLVNPLIRSLRKNGFKYSRLCKVIDPPP